MQYDWLIIFGFNPLIPILLILASALIIIGVPYGFISDIKDLRAKWGVTGGYASFIASLFVVIDLHHSRELWAEFSITKSLIVFSFIAIGTLVGWIIGALMSRRTGKS